MNVGNIMGQITRKHGAKYRYVSSVSYIQQAGLHSSDNIPTSLLVKMLKRKSRKK